MTIGISLHIGLNSVNPRAYAGWSGPLTACEADAKDMASLARSQRFKTQKLLTKQATRAAVTRGIAAAAKALKTGDIFFITYSGHGGQLPDLNGDEVDGLDETWCLYDGELVDDELYAAWAQFRAGVRVLVLSDSCHSGSVSRGALQATIQPTSGVPRRYRAMPRDLALRVYDEHKQAYDKILKDPKIAKAQASIKASVQLISGCQDNQLSADGDFNGLFTGTLKQVWNGGTFRGSYDKFHKSIRLRMPPDQTPRRSMVGAPNAAFEAQQPFWIAKPK
ncbi:MAG TPA: caspase family protein [Steroidobacteraceae bacterium]|nr:caspase family protein [Steroidobacteraceae bacterium]